MKFEIDTTELNKDERNDLAKALFKCGYGIRLVKKLIGQQYGEKNPYEYHTCSKWKMNERLKEHYLRAIVLGRVPPILDENFKLVSPQKASEAALRWAQFREEELAKIEKEKPPKEEFGRQLSLFD